MELRYKVKDDYHSVALVNVVGLRPATRILERASLSFRFAVWKTASMTVDCRHA